VSVDGRDIYHSAPRTSEVTGLASAVVVTNASADPLVLVKIPAINLMWPNKVELTKGFYLGVSLSTNDHVKVRQATNFWYD
jgi:hypothetical protein